MTVLYSRLLPILLGFTVLLTYCKTQQHIEPEHDDMPRFEYDETSSVNFIKPNVLSDVLDLAKEEGEKLTFVKFYTDWCLPCQVMDETVFVNKTLGEYYNTNFINYKVNAEQLEGPDLRFIFQVDEFPTFIFMDNNGRIILKDKGSQSTTNMMIMAETAIEEYNRIKNQANKNGE